LLSKLESEKGVQIAVVVLSDIQPQTEVFDFAQQLFDSWDIGDRKRDDGLLVLLVRGQTEEQLRAVDHDVWVCGAVRLSDV
jgi:uncharacterized membrane protein YgcG